MNRVTCTPPEVYAVDFETYYDNECSVVPLGPRAYCRHPNFDAYLVVVTGPEGTWVGHPSDYEWRKLKGKIVVSHNAAFDKTVYLWLHENDPKTYPHPDEFEEWNCTANLTAFLCNRRSLAQAWEYLYGNTVSKAVRTDMKGQRWETMEPAFQEKVMDYAVGDGEKCRKVWLDFHGRWPEQERLASLLTIHSTVEGVGVNMDLVKEYIAACQVELMAIESELPWMKDGKGIPTSPKEIALHCRKCGIPLPPVKYTDAEGFEAWEAEHSEKHSWIKGLGNWRQVNKALKTLETIQRRTVWLGDHYNMDAPLKYFGAHTGRWSGDSGVNFQNFRKKPIQANGVDIDIRKVFIPRPGYKFVIADYSQIEPRCAAWLSGDDEFLQMVRDGWSVYEAHAKASMGWTGKNLKQTDPALYALAKASRLGLGYGCGAAKFQVVAKALAGLELTEEESTKAVKDFRENNPKITGLWKTLQRTFAHSQGKKRDGSAKYFDMELPSGRMMRYPSVKAVVYTRKLKPGEEKPKDPKDLLESRLTADIGGKRVPFYGGKLCENLVQATARDVFLTGLLRVALAGYHIPFHVHDELVIEVPEDEPMEEVVSLLQVAPDWMSDLPTEVEAVEADHYQK